MKLLPFSRASNVTDFVAISLAFVLPLLLLSLWSARRRRNVVLHRRVQLSLASVLGAAVLVFEIDMRVNGWRHLAEPSPYFESLVFPALVTHLAFAIPTLSATEGS